MTKDDIVNKFNQITNDLLTDMKSIIGIGYSIKFNLLTTVNKSYAIKKFQLNVLKFKKYIEARNPNFFYNEKIIEKELENSTPEDREYYMNEYQYLKNIYVNVDDNSKDNIWDILLALIYLCENYHSD